MAKANLRCGNAGRSAWTRTSEQHDGKTDLEHLLNLGRLLDPHSRDIDHSRLVEFRRRVVDVQVRSAEHEPVLAPFAARRVAQHGEETALVGSLAAGGSQI